MYVEIAFGSVRVRVRDHIREAKASRQKLYAVFG